MKTMKKMKEYRVATIYDIIRALRENPEWLEEVRKLVLTDELLKLPKRFDDFVKHEFRPLVRRVDRIENDVRILKQDVAVLN